MSTLTGIHPLTSAEYHADPAEAPSLSSSIAHLLTSQSPAHAWTAHPRLNPDYAREDKGHYDVGTAAHALFLEGDENVVVVDADSWRTNAAKEAREEARANGKVALLIDTLASVQAMVNAIHRQLEAHGASPPMFEDGKPEQTVIWEESGVMCRARLDWLRDDFTAIDDLKSTSRSANPRSWSRTIFGMGYDVQAAFYARGVEKLTGVAPEFRLCVVETSPPYALSVIGLSPAAMTIGRKKVDVALELWRKCLAADEWPGYDTRIAYAELPPWEESQWLEQEMAAA